MGEADTSHLASSTRVTGKKVVRTDTRGWHVPYCSDCLTHVRYHRAALAVFVIACVLGAVLALTGIENAQTVGPAVAVLAALGGVLLVVGGGLLRAAILRGAEPYEKDGCASCGSHAVAYHGWQGHVHSLSFANPGYAARFRAINARKMLG
jgi:hypothetical protein